MTPSLSTKKTRACYLKRAKEPKKGYIQNDEDRVNYDKEDKNEQSGLKPCTTDDTKEALEHEEDEANMAYLQRMLSGCDPKSFRLVK